MNARRGMLYRRICLSTVMLWLCTTQRGCQKLMLSRRCELPSRSSCCTGAQQLTQRISGQHLAVRLVLLQASDLSQGTLGSGPALLTPTAALHRCEVALQQTTCSTHLHATHRAEHQYGAVQHAQSTLHLDREVHVSWRVDDVDARALCSRHSLSALQTALTCTGTAGRVRFATSNERPMQPGDADSTLQLYLPLAVGGRALDGDALLPLQVHMIHLGAHAILASHLQAVACSAV